MNAALTGTADAGYTVRGALVFATVARLARGAEPMFPKGGAVEIGLHEVTEADSAGLALLLQWRHRAGARDCRLRFTGVPQSLQVLAAVGGVTKLVDAPRAAS